MSKNISQSQLYENLNIPPSKANIKVQGPLQSTTAVNTKFFQMGVTASDLTPIDWREKVALSITMNQQDCGDCWAMSSTSALADRFIIQKWIAGLQLDPAVTAQCAQQDSINQGCQGGQPMAAGQFFEQYGVPSVSNECQTFGKICPNNKGCVLASCDDLNQQCKKATKYYASPGSTENLTVQNNIGIDTPRTVANIKRELMNGPVVASFFVPKDFMGPSIGYKWKATNGIYINGAYNNDLPNTMSKLSVSSPEEWADIIMENGNPAGHAVEIIGWGRGNAGPIYKDVSFWIVRNSWGPHWNEGGFFRIAMNDSGLNNNLGFDIPVANLNISSTGEVHPLGSLFGGCIAFAPDLDTGAPKGSHLPKPNTGHSKVNWHVILIILVCMLIIGGCGYYYYFNKNKVKRKK
jgi:hypothetical protein